MMKMRLGIWQLPCKRNRGRISLDLCDVRSQMTDLIEVVCNEGAECAPTAQLEVVNRHLLDLLEARLSQGRHCRRRCFDLAL
jgi:hypothetical protein